MIAPLIVLLVDFATKLALPTDPQLAHDIWIHPTRVLAVAVGLALAAKHGQRPLAIVAAGCVANGIDAQDGVVLNPLVFELPAGTLAMNPADLAVLIGLAGIAFQLVRATARVAARRLVP